MLSTQLSAVKGLLDQAVSIARDVAENSSEDTESSRKALLNIVGKLQVELMTPQEFLERQQVHYQQIACLRWLINTETLQNIPTAGTISYATLAAQVLVPEAQLRSVARMSITQGFLCEPIRDHVGHSRVSSVFATKGSMYDWAAFIVNTSAATAAKFFEATERWGRTEEKNQTAHNLAMCTDLPFFDYLKQSPRLGKEFAGYMKNVTNAEAMSLKHLVAGFDWAALPPRTKVVDVGGSSGHASIVLAQNYENLDFVVQDLPETLAAATAAKIENNIENNVEGAENFSRIRYMGHDFFQPQPVTDADIYLLRMIIHDWPFAQARSILQNLSSRMKAGARILIMDTVLPSSGDVPLADEQRLRVRDLTMIQVFNAKEREIEDWEALLRSAGLRITRQRQPQGSAMAILEVVKQEHNCALTDPATEGSAPVSMKGHFGDVKDEHASDAVNAHSKNSSNDHVVDAVNIQAEITSKDGASSVCNGHSEKLQLSQKPVLIIGAGMGGLCLGQGLKRAGIPFQIYERDRNSAFRAQGYRLKLEEDGVGALRDCLDPQLYEKLEASCATSTIGETDFNAISGQILNSREGSGLADGVGLKASLTADRTVLRRTLMEGLEGNITYSKELLKYREDAPNSLVTAIFKDGTSADGILLVGADGARSAVRKQYAPKNIPVDTGACAIYGKTRLTPEFERRFPEKALRWMTCCTDSAPLLQSILIGDSPVTLLVEPIRFDPSGIYRALLPADYVYWVLISRSETFSSTEDGLQKLMSASPEDVATMSLSLTREWAPELRCILEMQDVEQCSYLRITSSVPDTPAWTPSRFVTVLGDAIHVMSPCGGVGANTALKDAAELKKYLGNGQIPTSEGIGEYEQDMRRRATKGLMRSFVGSKKMFGQKPFSNCTAIQM